MISSLFIIVSHLCTMHKDEQRTDYYKVIFRFHCNTKHLIVKIVLHISQRSVLSEFLIWCPDWNFQTFHQFCQANLEITIVSLII